MRKSRLWTAAFSAVVGLAALVVLASCQGPVGDTGGAGPAGPAGPSGPAGTGDNAGPTVTGPIKTQYLVVGGSQVKVLPLPAKDPGTTSPAIGSYGSVEIDLNSYFRDTKTPSLSYKATSTDKTIASLNTSAITNVVTGTKLKVKAAGVGAVATAKSAMATITVEAYDAVNDPVSVSFDVIVVPTNGAPSVAGEDPIDDQVDTAAGENALVTPAVKNKLYMLAGTVMREFKATIHPGLIGTATEPGELSFRAIVGDGKGPDAVVSVTTPVLVGVNTYRVDITPKKPSISDAAADPTMPAVSALGAKKVQIFVKDSFGAEAFVTEFDVVVNRPPVVGLPLPNVILYRDRAVDTGGSIKEAVNWVTTAEGAASNIKYTLSTYFDDLDLDSIAAPVDGATTGVVTVGDTTCTFSTSPSQPTGRIADTTAAKAFKADLAKATSHATVNNGAADDTALMMKDLTTLRDGPDSATAEVLVNAAVVEDAVAPGTLGPFTLTITCFDLDKRVSSSARITVRDGTGA